jgi:hypothetical protein
MIQLVGLEVVLAGVMPLSRVAAVGGREAATFGGRQSD